MGSVLLVAEQHNGALKSVTKAVLSFAQQAAGRLGSEVVVAVFGDSVDGAANEIAGFGAAKVLKVESPGLKHYLAAPYATAIAEVATAVGAQVVCAPATTFGKDVMPRVAVKLGAGLAAEVIELAGDGATLQYKRPMWAGNIVGTVQVDTPVQVVTVRGSAFEDAAAGAASAVESHALAADLPSGAEFVTVELTGGERPDLAEADVVIAGGRGLKSKENFSIVEDLADVLGAAIGASRAAVDSGYAPNDWQIGQTGKVVAPNLYIAVAISGAIQHLAGMKNSKVIVAVNKDEEAPIFQVSDYGLVADAFKALPELTEKLQALKG